MVSIEYIAGLFDGEGWISVSEDKGYFRAGRNTPQFKYAIGIANNHRGVLEEIAKDYDAGIYTHGRQCATFILMVRSKDKKRFLEDILPFVIIKKPVVTIAIEMIKQLKPVGKRNRYSPLTEDEIAYRRQVAEKIHEINGSLNRRTLKRNKHKTKEELKNNEV